MDKTKKNEKQLYLPITPELAWINDLKEDIQRNRRIKKTDNGKVTNIEHTQYYNTEIQELGKRIKQFIKNP